MSMVCGSAGRVWKGWRAPVRPHRKSESKPHTTHKSGSQQRLAGDHCGPAAGKRSRKKHERKPGSVMAYTYPVVLSATGGADSLPPPNHPRPPPPASRHAGLPLGTCTFASQITVPLSDIHYQGDYCDIN